MDGNRAVSEYDLGDFDGLQIWLRAILIENESEPIGKKKFDNFWKIQFFGNYIFWKFKFSKITILKNLNSKFIQWTILENVIPLGPLVESPKKIIIWNPDAMNDIMHLPLKISFFGDSTRGPRGLCCVLGDSTQGRRGKIHQGFRDVQFRVWYRSNIIAIAISYIGSCMIQICERINPN